MLADLDELILKCKDKRASKTISEAVKCYKAGAYRSAIVAAWISTAYDIIDKLQKLALAGDKEAEAQIDHFEKIRRENDVTKALKFEKTLLELARDKFELISPVEYVDLDRLRNDRNRCAHPSMSTDSDIFEPSAELARVHIRSTVDHLLQHEAAQGKYALDKLLSDVQSKYFPTEDEQALAALRKSPLQRARTALTRNFLIVLLKTFLSGSLDYKDRNRHRGALLAVKDIQPEAWRLTLKDELSRLMRSIATTEPSLLACIQLLEIDPSMWDAVDNDVRTKLGIFVTGLPSDMLDDIDWIYHMPIFQKEAKERIEAITRKEILEPLFFDAPPPLLELIHRRYISAPNFDSANTWGKAAERYADEFSDEQRNQIISSASKNDQILGSFEFPAVLAAFRKRSNMTSDEFDAFLKANNLEEFIFDDDIPF